MTDSTLSVLVTGASSGIGLAAAKKLSENGYAVTGVARRYTDESAFQMDKQIVDLADIDALPTRLNTLGGAFDALVLNAGYGRFGGLEQFSHTQIRHLVDTNLVSNLFLIKHYLPAMKRSGQGDIVLIGSESALQGARNGAVYCATKFALRGLAQSLRADCANSNVRVVLINPGPVSSDFFNELDFEPHHGPEFVIEPETIAETVLTVLTQPRTVVTEEVNLQPIKRSFQKKKTD